MKVAVDAGKPVRPSAEPPAPRDGRALEGFTVGRGQERIGVRVAVEDAHQALAVAHQLADAPLVEGGLVALLGVRLGQEPAEGTGALVIEIVRGPGKHPVEVQPVERSRRLFDQLEVFGGVARRNELARLADEPNIQASHVARERVVGAVRVDRLPRPVGRVVVAEPLHGPRARHHERPEPTAGHALDLEGHAIPQALGIGGASIAQRVERQDLDRAATDPPDVVCQRLLPDQARVGHASPTSASLAA